MEEIEFLENETGSNPVGCVIWMHGLGADATDFEPIVPLLPLAFRSVQVPTGLTLVPHLPHISTPPP